MSYLTKPDKVGFYYFETCLDSMESHMARYAIPEPKIKTLPIVGKDEVFPVRRVYCIGRNYAAHAVEMGHDPDKEDPLMLRKLI